MSLQRIKVFISSPSDVKKVREIVERILDDLNLHLAKHLGLELKPLLWEEITPRAGLAQEIVLKEFPPDTWDIFIGILWNRFGTPTGMSNPATGKPYESGTEQEFDLAYRQWKATARPKILFYRCTKADAHVYRVGA